MDAVKHDSSDAECFCKGCIENRLREIGLDGGGFADNTAGLTHAIEQTLFLRRAGNKTWLVGNVIAGHVVHFLEYTPPPRLTRKERGAL